MRSHLPALARLFKNDKGKRVLWQTPNIPITGWAVFTVLTHVLSDGKWQSAAGYISFGFIFTWAWLEITQGSNYFRRLLGILVLMLSIHSRIG